MSDSNDLSVAISNLTKARDLVSDPQNWGKGQYFSGDPNDCDYQVCAQGSLQRIGVELPKCRVAARMFDPNYEIPLEHSYLYEAVLSLDSGHNSVISFNDDPETTHADIMRLFSRAIHLAKSDELEYGSPLALQTQSTPKAAFTLIDDTMTFDEAKKNLLKTLSRIGISVEETAK